MVSYFETAITRRVCAKVLTGWSGTRGLLPPTVFVRCLFAGLTILATPGPGVALALGNELLLPQAGNPKECIT
jgi:hypothetical protein